uniref:hypothetical protein n=1 Tax=Salmonella enterica TaxID=28901 RepID=UPI003296F32D
ENNLRFLLHSRLGLSQTAVFILYLPPRRAKVKERLNMKCLCSVGVAVRVAMQAAVAVLLFCYEVL